MRLLFVTEDDPLYVIHFFDVFFHRIPAATSFRSRASRSARRSTSSKIATARRTLRLYGIADFTRLAAARIPPR